jgi:hypothetical protein
MLNQTIDRLTADFGPMTSSTNKMLRWEVRPDVGVGLERSSRRGQRAYLWLPHAASRSRAPSSAEVYGPAEGRHSNAYMLPGLKQGMGALRVRIARTEDLDEVVDYVRGLEPLRTAA